MHVLSKEVFVYLLDMYVIIHAVTLQWMVLFQSWIKCQAQHPLNSTMYVITSAPLYCRRRHLNTQKCQEWLSHATTWHSGNLANTIAIEFSLIHTPCILSSIIFHSWHTCVASYIPWIQLQVCCTREDCWVSRCSPEYQNHHRKMNPDSHSLRDLPAHWPDQSGLLDCSLGSV